MVDKDRIGREEDEMLVRMLVAYAGADYKTEYSPHLWPEFSEETIAVWEEIEKRMKGTRCLGFDREGCLRALREEIKKQEGILKGGADVGTSFHYGVKSGLNLAWRIIEGHIVVEE